MEAALPLESVEFDLSVEQSGDVSSMSAEQYLSWVRYQAGNLPNVKRVEAPKSLINRQSKYMPEISDISDCPIDCLPSEEWQRELLYTFSELRQTLERLSLEESSKERRVAVPQMKDRDAWHRFCFAAEIDPLSARQGDAETVTIEMGETVDGIVESELPTPTVNTEQRNNEDLIDSADVTSAADRAVIKRKRDLAYQLGITLVKKTEESAFEVTQHSRDSAVPADDRSDDEDGCGEDLDYVENDEVNAAIEGAWALAAKAMQWSGAVDVEPTTTVLLQFDQVLTQRLLAVHIDWMEERSLTPARGRWLYALLARLEKPLYRETAASIRQLYRRCCALRYQLSLTSDSVALAAESSGDAESDANSAVKFQNSLASLNVLISICGSYFGQGEEYDAFNRALMTETAQADAEQEDEEGDFEDEDDYDEDEGEYEEESEHEHYTSENTGVGQWQTVSVLSAQPVTSNTAGHNKTGSSELEEGEEPEDEVMDCPSGKKSRV